MKATIASSPLSQARGEAATLFGLLMGTLGKMARDLSLMMQSEIAEASEPVAPGRGGSSTLPHKRNPVTCAAVLAAATRVPGLVSTMLAAMVQEHERALGGWQAEWDTLPQIICLTGGALEQMMSLMPSLEIDKSRMLANLEATRGLMTACWKMPRCARISPMATLPNCLIRYPTSAWRMSSLRAASRQ